MGDSTRLLLIEDDHAVAQSLTEGLVRAGYDVHWEETGTGGVAHAKAADPHLIILDLRLPDGSGLDFCRAMRAAGLRQPILILSVASDELDKVLGLEMGADDYMTKPFRLRELLARIRALLRRAYGELSAAQSTVLLVGDLVIDRNAGIVRRGARRLALTPLEFRLLVYLAQHPGQVRSRTELIENVWGISGELYDDKSVNAYVRRLREKVEADPSDPKLILTVPGQGYRLATVPA
jgi:DNA-binding response OmpR family regulator